MKPVSYRPYIVEDESTKTLHFNSLHVQSEMRKDAPHELTLGYTRAMMGFLLFQPRPLDILIVGLGGGSLSKYCHYLLPESRVTTIEISRDVIALRDLFCIPEDGGNFSVVHADAAEYIRGKAGIADVILLDGYDDFGLPEELGTTSFYGNCRQALREGGVLVANIHGDDYREDAYIGRLGREFDGKVLQVSSMTSFNQIAFALNNVSPLPLEVLQERATTFKHQTGLPFTRFMNQMWKSAMTSGDGHNWLVATLEAKEFDQPDMGCSMISI